MKNKKEVAKRRKAKKEKKERARKLKRRMQREERAEARVNKVDIGSTDDWMDYLGSDNVAGRPFGNMTVFPLEGPRMLGRADHPGLFSTFCLAKFSTIWRQMGTGEISPDHLAIGVLWSKDDHIKGEDPSLDASSLIGLEIRDLYEKGVFCFDNLEQFATMIEESVRNACAMHEERMDTKIRSFGVFFEGIEGPFKESHLWKKFSEDAEIIHREQTISP